MKTDPAPNTESHSMPYDYKKGLFFLSVTFLIWGFQPLYWNLGGELDTLFLMLLRICFSGIFCILILLVQGKMGRLKEALLSRSVMKKEIPAAVLLCVDWFVYLFAVRNGQIQEVSLGYYVMPIVIFFFGAILYHEKIRPGHWIVLGLLILGILVSVKGFGSFPWTAVILSLAFAVYSAIKKGAVEDGVVSTSLEILLMCPFAIAALFFFFRGSSSFANISAPQILFFAGSGAVTAIPMLFYSLGVKRLPMFTTALGHYISPTFAIICSFILGEHMTREKLISFLFIWAGIIVYTKVSWK